jgi:tRNA-splicing ligase RtcB
MTPSDLLNLGFEPSPAVGEAIRALSASRDILTDKEAADILGLIARHPETHLSHPIFGHTAELLLAFRTRNAFTPRPEPAPYQVWGSDIDKPALDQMSAAARLPVAVRGALMPDAHVGYGLPIGGVLATHNAVIPYAVGVDIACRMRLTVFPLPPEAIDKQHDRLVKILQRETVFGAGAVQRKPEEHEVLEEDWTIAPVVSRVHDKAKGQLGTSGSGNHFVEWGTLTVSPPSPNPQSEIPNPQWTLPPGSYLALLSHSGSRGPGATVADFFSRLAMDLHPELPADLKRLAWLDLDKDEGREYWAAMELMGRFAAANHAVIHRKVAKALGESPLASIENHHNFAWKETHDGHEVIVHRKGATPAGPGVLGVIPGSMASPGFVVAGKGVDASLHSASHGAGRRMSRTAAKNSLRWGNLKPMLAEAKVTLLAAGIDEAPPAYKDIHQVMTAQQDLVQVLARFDPRIVRMADAGEAPED